MRRQMVCFKALNTSGYLSKIRAKRDSLPQMRDPHRNIVAEQIGRRARTERYARDARLSGII